MLPAVMMLCLSVTTPRWSTPTKHTADTALKTENGRKVPPAGSKNAAKVKKRTVSAMNRDNVKVVGNPDSTLVLVNKYFKLPDHFIPKDLIEVQVPFISGQHSEKTKMRRPAAKALERLFIAAEKDGIHLAGVSAYRSRRMQQVLFNHYVQKDGEKRALTYSARPGTSEHESGLAVDVSGASGQGAASPAFARTAEATWLSRHAAKYGFIIRYPQGKENITGYEYEAWHLRYVGEAAAETMVKHHLTLEEYLEKVPVVG